MMVINDWLTIMVTNNCSPEVGSPAFHQGEVVRANFLKQTPLKVFGIQMHNIRQPLSLSMTQRDGIRPDSTYRAPARFPGPSNDFEDDRVRMNLQASHSFWLHASQDFIFSHKG